MFRWAWRLFRREWRQQLLVLALLTVAVAAATAGSAFAVGWPASATAATFGTADHLVTVSGPDPRLAAGIAAVRARFPGADVIENRAVTIPGSVATMDLRAQDPAGRYGRPLLALVSGRYPAGPGEVAVTSQVATAFRLKIGTIWRQAGRTRRVTGIVDNPQNLLDEFALVAPGQLGAPTQVTILFDATAASAASFRFPAGAVLATPAQPSRGLSFSAGLVLVLDTLGLLFIGLVAVAGFTVMAQRRLRALGMLGAIGATDRNVRQVLLANGAIVGVAGAVIGAAAGIAGWLAFAPRLQNLAEHRIDGFSLPWPAIGGAMALAVATAIAAAWWPARSAARVPIVAALSGRPARPRLAHRFTVLGVALLAGGLISLVFADDNGGQAPLVLTGIVGTVLGVMFLGPPVITALAAAGRSAPVAVRLALRDLARYQARSGAALAAVCLAAGIAATIVLAITQAAEQSAQAAPAGPNLPANQLIVHLASAGGVISGVFAEPSPAQRSSLQDRVRSLAASLHARAVLTLDAAASPEVPAQGGNQSSPAGQETVALVKSISSCPAPAVEGAGQVYVATAPLLAHYGIRPASIRPGTQLLTSRADLAGAKLATGDGPSGCSLDSPNQFVSHPVIQNAGLPADTSGPSTLVTVRAMRALGWRPVPAGWLIQTARPLTAAQVNAARLMAAAAGVTVETHSGQVSLTVLGAEISAGGLLLTLGVLAMTVGLIRGETAGDLRTLTAAGASTAVRRTLTGATAGALALLGAVLGTAVAYLAIIAWHRSDLSTLSDVPVASLLIILAGLPLTAAASGWLLGGREPHGIARQPIE